MNWNKGLAAHILRNRLAHRPLNYSPLTPVPASAESVTAVLDQCRQAAEANRACAARRGNVVHLTADNAADAMVVADLHGNRLNFTKLLAIADLANQPQRHLIMQEVCHGGPGYPAGAG